MRLALFADIHGNADALTAALQGAKREGVDEICVAGDFVGYYYQPVEVLSLLSKWTVHAIRGNHEDMLLRAEKDDEYLAKCTAKYGSGLSVALRDLSSLEFQSLQDLPLSLPLEFDDCRLLLAHGAPWDTNHYVYPNASTEVWTKLDEFESFDFLVLGHTHYRLVKKLKNGVVINPGSVGQPRDGAQGACWALIDTATLDVRSFTEKYDTTRVIREAKLRDPHIPYLHQIFDRK